MGIADIALAAVLAAVCAAVFGAFFDLAPLLAKAMVRRAARWWHSDLDSAEELAEEWQALIEERPVGSLKLVTGLGFLARATFRHGAFVARPFAGNGAWLLGRLAAAYIRALKSAFALLRRFRPRGAPGLASLAVFLFLVGAVLGQWIALLAAGLVACVSRFYTRGEKLALVVAVPVATALCYAVGFWLHQRGLWGGTTVHASDLLAGAASFFGTLPRMVALLDALFLGWRLARQGALPHVTSDR